MARARNIKPGLLKNEVLGVADPLLTILFQGLWLLADREGRLEDRPMRIKAEVFPYRDGIDIDLMLNWLQANGFIRRYKVAGKGYVVVLEFVKHQNPHKNEPESAIPPPECADATTEEIGTTSEKIGSTRADSLIPDSLIPDSVSEEANASSSSPAEPTTAKRGEVPCPYAEIIAAYHELLPMLPSVRIVTEKRKREMRKLWGWVLSSRKPNGDRRATSADEAIRWFREYFARCADDAFITGQTPRGKGHEGWEADLSYLLREDCLVRIAEKTGRAAA